MVDSQIAFTNSLTDKTRRTLAWMREYYPEDYNATIDRLIYVSTIKTKHDANIALSSIKQKITVFTKMMNQLAFFKPLHEAPPPDNPDTPNI